jgi:Glycosyl transferase family 2
MDFSIIFPSRKRIPLLAPLLRSISTTATDPKRVEVLVAYDDDDDITHEFFTTLEAHENIYCDVRPFRVPRSKNFSRDYYSMLGKHATGRWIIVCNDDAIFETQGWDALAYEKLKDEPNIVYGWIEDCLAQYRLEQYSHYCCFPLLGKEGVDILGYVFPETIPTWGADIWIRKLYDSLGRIVDLPMTIKHISHHNGLRPQDDLNKEFAQTYSIPVLQPSYQEVNLLLSGMRRYVEAGHGS